jgi:CubicO group peptidase (beta-lactamase class C family)
MLNAINVRLQLTVKQNPQQDWASLNGIAIKPRFDPLLQDRTAKMKIHRFSAICLILVAISSLSRIAMSQDGAAKVEISSTLQTKLNQFDAYAAKALVDWQVPGLSIAIVKDDQVLLSKGYGVRRVGNPEMVDQNTLFAIASNSKAFTAAALAILVDEGKLSWDDHVTKHLPWFRLKDEFASRDIRVRDLLCHRSGLGTFSGDLLWWGTNYTPREILERTVHLEPASSFRSEFGYSNLMFLAAGEVIVAVSGKSWPDFVQERILRPLAMRRTITSVRDLIAMDNYATPHKTQRDRSEPIAWMNWDSMAAAGGIISSADDMTHWLRLQLKRGALNDKQRIFSEKESHEMWQAQTALKLPMVPSKRFPSMHFSAYGLGWGLSDYQARKVVKHSGGYDGMNSQVVLVPEENLGIVVLTNSLTPISNLLAFAGVDTLLGIDSKDWSQDNLEKFRKSREEFQANITKAITPVVEGTKPSHPLTDYTGNYRCPMYGDATVSIESDKLVLSLHPYPALVANLKHLHYDTFEIQWRSNFAWFDGGTAHFVADAQGKFQRIELNVPNEDLFFHELKLHRR